MPSIVFGNKPCFVKQRCACALVSDCVCRGVAEMTKSTFYLYVALLKEATLSLIRAHIKMRKKDFGI